MRFKIADTETCSFKGPDETSSGVCDVAFLEIDKDLNILDIKSSLINPGRAISPEASAIHGLYDQDVYFSPKLDEFYARNWDDSPTVLICHNVVFDKKFLEPHLRLEATLCTLALARQYIKNTTNHQLPTLARELGLETGVAHRASGDVVTTHSLLKYIVNLTGRTLLELVELGRKPVILTTMPFGEHKGKRIADIPKGYLDWVMTQDFPSDVRRSVQLALKMK